MVVRLPRLRDNIDRVINSDSSDREKLETVVRLLHDGVDHYDWVGFYIASPAEKKLSLGPFSGAPTEHTDIGYGQGVCGQAAERKDTFIVADVSQENNYLSCSPEVRSEIVLPIFSNDELVGELDIDSHRVSAFTEEDEEFLDDVCRLVSGLL